MEHWTMKETRMEGVYSISGEDGSMHSHLIGFISGERQALLARAAPELLEHLEARLAQTRCGCGNWMCRPCKEDDITESVILRAKSS